MALDLKWERAYLKIIRMETSEKASRFCLVLLLLFAPTSGTLRSSLRNHLSLPGEFIALHDPANGLATRRIVNQYQFDSWLVFRDHASC